MADNPQNTSLNSALDLRELAFEHFLGQVSYFHLNPAVTLNWPTPNTSLASNSVVTNAVDIRGRYHHYIQAKGINVTTGDTVTMQVSIDGTNFVNASTTSINATSLAATITVDGIYYITGNFWYIRASIAAGTNTGTTNLTLMSRPD